MTFLRFPAAWTITARKMERAGHEEHWRLCGQEAAKRLHAGQSWAARVRSGRWAVDDWVVEGMFRKRSVIMLAGESGLGKTWLLRDLVVSLARGDRWLGRYECLTGPTIYCMGEDDLDLTTRRDICLLLGRGADVLTFLREKADLLTDLSGNADSNSFPYMLSSTEWKRRVEDFITGAPDQQSKPLAWIFDPIATMIRDTDQGGEDLKTAITWCSWLAKHTDGVVVLSHHMRKPSGREESLRDRIRGDSNLFNLVDDVLVIVGDEDDSAVLKIYHLKSKNSDTPSALAPAFLVRRVFEQVTPEEEMALFRSLNVNLDVVKPGTLFRVRHVCFNREEAPQREVKEHREPVVESDGDYGFPAWHEDALSLVGEAKDGVSWTGLADQLRSQGVRVGASAVSEWLKAAMSAGLIGVFEKRPVGRGRPYSAYRVLSKSAES